MLFPGRTMSVYLSLVGSSRARPRYVGQAGRENCQCRSKASLQHPFGTQKIHSRYLNEYRPLVKNNNNNTYWENCKKSFNMDKNRAKSHNLSSINQL